MVSEKVEAVKVNWLSQLISLAMKFLNKAMQANLITCFSSTKIQISIWAGCHFSLFIIKENTPNQAVCWLVKAF